MQRKILSIRQRFGLYIAQRQYASTPPYSSITYQNNIILRPHLGLSYQKNSSMSEDTTVNAGQTRPKPGSSSPPQSPIVKKPRLEDTGKDARPQPKATASTPRKSAKKEARKVKKKGLHVDPEPYSTEAVLWRDVAAVLGDDIVAASAEGGTDWNSPFEFRQEVEVEVHSISASGESFIAYLIYVQMVHKLFRRRSSTSTIPPPKLGHNSPLCPPK